MTLALGILALVVLQRGAEIIYASRNARALAARGGIEHARAHYPVIVLLHVSWLIAIAAGILRAPQVRWLPLVIFGVLQVFRLWVLLTLGPYWTTRIVTIPGEPLVRRGPYRFVRHPNYLVVTGEMAVLPLVFGQVGNAVIFSILNLAVLAWRIRRENEVLEPRRRLTH